MTFLRGQRLLWKPTPHIKFWSSLFTHFRWRWWRVTSREVSQWCRSPPRGRRSLPSGWWWRWWCDVMWWQWWGWRRQGARCHPQMVRALRWNKEQNWYLRNWDGWRPTRAWWIDDRLVTIILIIIFIIIIIISILRWRQRAWWARSVMAPTAPTFPTRGFPISWWAWLEQQSLLCRNLSIQLNWIIFYTIKCQTFLARGFLMVYWCRSSWMILHIEFVWCWWLHIWSMISDHDN